MAWRLGGVELENPESIEITKACYAFRKIDFAASKTGAALEVKALTQKTVRFDHVIWLKQQ